MKTNMSNKREQIIDLRKCGLPSNRQRDYWKEEERQMLQDMFYEGEGISDMAITFHRSEVAIINQINSMQLYEKVRNPRQKRTIADVANAIKQTVKDMLKPTANNDKEVKEGATSLTSL